MTADTLTPICAGNLATALPPDASQLRAAVYAPVESNSLASLMTASG